MNSLNYIMLNYCLLDTICFTYLVESFIRVTSLRDRRLTAPIITAQLNQYREKCVNIHCEAGLYGKIAVKNSVEEAKQYQKTPVGQSAQTLDNRAME